jgi:hypothetical protein
MTTVDGPRRDDLFNGCVVLCGRGRRWRHLIGGALIGRREIERVPALVAV